MSRGCAGTSLAKRSIIARRRFKRNTGRSWKNREFHLTSAIFGSPPAPAGAGGSGRHGFQGFVKNAHPWLSSSRSGAGGTTEVVPPRATWPTSLPRQGRGELLQPLPGGVSMFLFCPGVRFAHPRLISLRPAGAEFVTVFMKSCTLVARRD